MLGISWPEMGVIAVIALIVIGPKDLPRVLRAVGQWMGKAQRMASDFRRALDQAAREAGVDEVKKAVETAGSLTPAGQVKKAIANTIAPPAAAAASPAAPRAQDAKAAEAKPVINPTTGDPVAPAAKANGHAQPGQPAAAAETPAPPQATTPAAGGAA